MRGLTMRSSGYEDGRRRRSSPLDRRDAAARQTVVGHLFARKKAAATEKSEKRALIYAHRICAWIVVAASA